MKNPGVPIISILIFLLSAELAAEDRRQVQADYHHVHMRAVDTASAAAWYAANMKGERTKVGPYDAVSFGGTQLLFYPAGQPGADGSPTAGELGTSAGSGIDHLGFSFVDLDAALELLEGDGAKILTGPRDIRGLFKFAFIEDPWGQKIEVMEDLELTGFHHVHLLSTNPDRTIEWFQQYFGGEIGRFKALPPLRAIQYDDMWLIVTKSETPVEPTMFRMVDHLGWVVPAMSDEMDRMKIDGVKIVKDKFLFGGIRNIAFIESPTGILIEILEPARE